MVALFDHLRVPVAQPLSKVTDVPQTLALPPFPVIITVGVAGVVTMVATTGLRLAAAVSQLGAAVALQAT